MQIKQWNKAMVLIAMWNCGTYSDSKTLRHAIIIAHHQKDFSKVHPDFREYIPSLAAQVRAAYPCPCKKCSRP